MRKFITLFLSLIALVAFSNLSAQPISEAFEDDSDVANWSHYDETNFFTVEAWDSSGGVDGTGALRFTDAGFDMLAKRPVSVEAGMDYYLSMDVKVANWDGSISFVLQGVGAVDETVDIISFTDFTRVTMLVTAANDTGYIKFVGLNSFTPDTVWVDNLYFAQWPNNHVVINELDADQSGSDTGEFIELYDGGLGNVPLDSLSVVLYNGSDIQSYEPAFDLDGFRTDANGYFVIGSTGMGTPIEADPGGSGWLQNGSDAVALIVGNAADFPTDTPLSTDNVIDAVVYDTDDADNPGLLVLINPGQPQVDERGGGNGTAHSNQRYPNGAGGALNTDTYIQDPPTMGAPNQNLVSVTFNVNTSTVPDTIRAANAFVQVRGGIAPLTWGSDSPGLLTSVGGDYWTVTLDMPAGASGAYKIFANATGDGDAGGWESDPSASLTVPEADTVLPVQYFVKQNDTPHFDPPFTATDSLDLWFRVNVARLVQFGSFNPATQVMGVRGLYPGAPGGDYAWGDLSWGSTAVLAPETGSDNGGQFTYAADNFWSGRVRVPNDSAMMRVDSVIGFGYKFVVADANDPNNVITWEGGDDRRFPVPQGLQDSTIHWRWFDDLGPVEAVGTDTANFRFVADMTRALTEQGFEFGDTLLVKWGFNGTAIAGTDTMTRQGISNRYAVTVVAANVQLDSLLEYEYNVIFNGEDRREIFFDFTSDDLGASAEKRKAVVTLADPNLVEDVAVSETEMRRQPRFENLSELPGNISVVYECDLRPAYFQVLLQGDSLIDIQTDRGVGPSVVDSIFNWGVWMNGLAVGGWGNPDGIDWGADLVRNLEKKMYDDGDRNNEGDVAEGDSVYSLTMFYSGPDSGDAFGQVFKFGIYGGDNEAGSTASFGNNHLENIPYDETQDTVYVFSQFGSINPSFYWVWSYDDTTLSSALSIADLDGNVITSPELHRNYPNPFNPVTTISFALPKAQDVKLIVYNALGQEVYRMWDGQRPKGVHVMQWGGIDKRGNQVATGMYFYRLTTEDYQKTMKMMLLK